MACFPPEWDDDNRMNFMFSAFPENRDVNPKHWDSKIQFWRTVILDSCGTTDELFIDVGTLKSRFQRNGVYPLGLGTVLKNMFDRGEIIPWNEFLDSVYDSWGSWSYGMMKKTFWWSVGKVWQDDTEINSGTYIVLDLLKRKTESVLSCHYQTVTHFLTDNIVPMKVLKTRLHTNNVKVNDQELDVVICQLRKEGKVSVHISQDGEKVLKFADKNGKTASAVSETDLNILRLKKAEASIQLQIRKIQKDIEELQSITVTLVKQGSRKKARKILSKKHMLSKTLDKKESLLLNTQDILQRIQEAHTDANVIEALKAGAQVFKSMSQELGLTVDNVEKIMGDVEEVMDDAAEIDRTIEGLSGSCDEEIEDLEKELEELLIGGDNLPKAETDKTGDILANLPDIPSTEPSPVKIDHKDSTRTSHKQDKKPTLTAL